MSTGRPALLVVDDDSSIRESDILIFEDTMNVTEAGDAAATIDAARRRRFDAILLDVRMPGISGMEAFSPRDDAGREGVRDARAHRVARSLLRETRDSLEVIAERVGLCDAPHLARVFRQRTRRLPRDLPSVGRHAGPVAPVRRPSPRGPVLS